MTGEQPSNRAVDAAVGPATADALPSAEAMVARARERERARPADRRRADGQFSTPAPVARALVDWAVRPADDGGLPRVLDPAVGGGVFAREALVRLERLAAERAPSEGHAGLPAGQVTAVDPDARALAATREALAPAGAALKAVEASFLACDPADLGRFDAVVGNPPYVRQEGLEKGTAREHLAAFGPDGEAPYRDGERAIDRRSDAYVYFLTNATRFLRPDGHLAMVVPTKWLSTRYGETLQRFLLEHYRVHSVVGFGVRAFDDALVDAGLVCLERRPAGVDGAAPPARFVRVAEPVDGPTLAEALDAGPAGEDGSAVDGDSAGQPDRRAPTRTVAVPREDLAERVPGKLGHYLSAPPVVLELLEADGLVPLGEQATVTYGRKTGANDFFLVDDPDAVDDQFLAPAVASFRQVDGLVLDGDPPTWLLDVGDYIAGLDRRGGSDATGGDGNDAFGGDGDAAFGGDGDDATGGDGDNAIGGPGDDDTASGDPAEAVLRAMAADGYAATVEYVRAGAEAGYLARGTCASRRVWFDLGELAAPALLHPKFFDERVAVVHNRGGFAPTNAIDCLAVAEDVPTRALLGALNSTLHAVMLECFGRAEGGGALQLMTYELERVPTLPVRALPDDAVERLGDAFAALARGEAGARRRLDAVVLEHLDADVGVDALVDARERLVRRRVDRGRR